MMKLSRFPSNKRKTTQMSFLFLFRLCTLWKQIFGTSLVNHLSETNFPLLIGVKHEIAQIDQWFATPKYQYEFLVKGNQLPRYHQTITLQPFLDELKTFRLSFDKIEQKLVRRRKKTDNFIHTRFLRLAIQYTRDTAVELGCFS